MRQRNRAKLVVMLAVVGMSTSAVFVRWADMPSVALAAWRMIFTVVLLLPVVLKNHRQEIRALTGKDWAMCCLSGLFLGLHLFAYFEAVKNTTIASGMILLNTKVLFIPLVLLVVFHERIPRMGWYSVMAAFAGVVVTALGDRSGGSNVAYGDGMALVASVGISVYTLIGREQRKSTSTTVYTFLVYGAAGLTLSVASLAQGVSLMGGQTRDYASALGMAVFCTLLGHSLTNWALKYLSAAFISVCNLGEPILTIIASIFLYDEIPTAYQIAGSVIVLGAICLYTFCTDVRVPGWGGRRKGVA